MVTIGNAINLRSLLNQCFCVISLTYYYLKIICIKLSWKRISSHVKKKNMLSSHGKRLCAFHRQKYFTCLLHSLDVKYFPTLIEKFCISDSAWPFNILYIFDWYNWNIFLGCLCWQVLRTCLCLSRVRWLPGTVYCMYCVQFGALPGPWSPEAAGV